jgi:hypothetical protein
MKDRIEINGVWYVKETNSTPTFTPKLEPSISFEGLVFESDLYCFEVTRLRDDDGEFYDKQCDIKFIDKNLKDTEPDHWDNSEWMVEFLKDDPEAIEEAEKCLCPQGIVEFKAVVKELSEKGWI